ncbi:MAG: glucose-1-phosphate thymidylyltransferase, partial [Desulfovibrionaceae bacterium]
SLLRAANYVNVIQDRQGALVSCVEEIAFRKGYIDAAQLERLAAPMLQNEYGRYLMEILAEAREGL